MKKERSDSKLGRLSTEQRAQLRDWMLEGGLSYRECSELVKKEFGVSVGSDALHHFFQRVCVPVRASRLQESARAAEEIGELNAGAFDAATTNGIKQLCFEAMTKGADPETLQKLMSLVLVMRDQEIKREKLGLDRDRFEFDAAKAALEALEELRAIRNDASLNSDEKIQKVRERLWGKRPSPGGPQGGTK